MFTEEEHKKVQAAILDSPIKRITYTDDCFVPFREVSINYSGPNIAKVVRMVPTIMAKTLQVSGTKIVLDAYYWDHVDANDKVFHIMYNGEKTVDARSKIRGEVMIKDGHLKPDGSGSMELQFSAKLITNFERRTLFQRSSFYDMLVKIYTYSFYDNTRRNFLAMCNDYMEVMMRELRAALNLMKRGEDYGT